MVSGQKLGFKHVHTNTMNKFALKERNWFYPSKLKEKKCLLKVNSL